MNIHGVAPLLQVFDMPTAIRFYRDVLGFTVWSSSEPGDNCNWCGLRLNGAEVMLNTAYEADQRPPVPDLARVAAHEDTCLFFGCKDLDAAYRRAHRVNLNEPCAVWHEAAVVQRSRRIRALLPMASKPEGA